MPGGFVQPIPESVRRAVTRMAPNAEWHSLEALAEMYQLERDYQPKRQPGSATRKALDGIVLGAATLHRDLMLLSEEARDAIGDWAHIDATAQHLRWLAQSSKIGHNQTEAREGRPRSLRKRFVRNIAATLTKCGYEVDATPNGLLVAVTSELLNVYGDKPADVPALVREALRENLARPA